MGALLTFVLSLGANAEAGILGGPDGDRGNARAIEQRFNYAQDWPLGAALTMLVIVVTAVRGPAGGEPARSRPADPAADVLRHPPSISTLGQRCCAGPCWCFGLVDRSSSSTCRS